MTDTLQYPNSDRALHQAHRTWVPDYHNPYNIILTFANNVSEQYAREKYNRFVNRVSEEILNNAYRRNDKLIETHGYLEYAGGGYHVHTLINVYKNWDSRFEPLVRSLWPHGLVIEIKKVPHNELAWAQQYNSKMKTKKSGSGYFSDNFLIVNKSRC